MLELNVGKARVCIDKVALGSRLPCFSSWPILSSVPEALEGQNLGWRRLADGASTDMFPKSTV